MAFIPRPYQTSAIDAAVKYFHGNARHHAFEILPTGSGKSVVIASIAKELEGNTLVFQPSKEILEQNVLKYKSYGFKAGVYSASANSKHIEKTTFATIGSVVNKPYLFRDFKNIVVDECHLVNSDAGMYQEFFSGVPGCKVLGLTATPYRLSSVLGEGSQLTFLNRSQPRFFSEVLYYIQNGELFDAGHLSPLEYYKFDLVDRNKLELNANGSDFTDASVRAYFRSIDMPTRIAEYTNRALKIRKNALVFCSLISEARQVASKIPGAYVISGDTPDADRARLLTAFKSGRIRCLVNVGVLTTGFDYPELETVVIGKSTMSLSLYYQIIGRVMRPHKNKKSGWVIDLGGNIDVFGKIETMEIRKNKLGQLAVFNNGRQLTDVTFTRN